MDFFLETTFRPLGGAAPWKFLHGLKTDQALLAHTPRWDGVPQKNFDRENLKYIWPKIQRFKVNNFRASGSILMGLFSVDAPRSRDDKMGTIFTIPTPKKFVTAKNRPKFFAIFDNFRLWSRISPERIDISKIGKALDHL